MFSAHVYPVVKLQIRITVLQTLEKQPESGGLAFEKLRKRTTLIHPNHKNKAKFGILKGYFCYTSVIAAFKPVSNITQR